MNTVKRFLVEKTFTDNSLEIVSKNEEGTETRKIVDGVEIFNSIYNMKVEYEVNDSNKIVSFTKSGTPKDLGIPEFDKYNHISYSEKNRENEEDVSTHIEIHLDNKKLDGWYYKNGNSIVFSIPYIAFVICDRFNSVYEYVNRIVTRKFKSVNPMVTIQGKIEYFEFPNSNIAERIGFTMFPQTDKTHDEPLISSSTVFRMVDGNHPITELSIVDGQILDYSRFDKGGNIISRKTASYFKSICDFILTKYVYEDYSDNERIVKITSYTINGIDVVNTNTIIKTQRKLCSPTGEMKWYTTKEVKTKFDDSSREKIIETFYDEDNRKKISSYYQKEYIVSNNRNIYIKTRKMENNCGKTTTTTKKYYKNRVTSVETKTTSCDVNCDVVKYIKEVVVEEYK